MRRAIWTVRRIVSTLRPQEGRRVLAVWRAVDLRAVRIEPRRSRRLLNAAASLLRNPPVDGPIWAISMVKNEADILAETIENLFAQGVDRVLIADNGSTDGSPLIADRAGAILVRDPLVPYWQGHKMSHLARSAVRNGAAWIVPFDADELWKGTSGRTLADVLKSATTSIVEADWIEFLPLVDDPGAPTVARRIPWRRPLPDEQIKVAFRANWLARVGIGAHFVFVPDQAAERSLRVAHYRWRSASQMLRKANEGARAAKLAGERPQAVPQWFEIEGLDVDEVGERLSIAALSAGLVRDPSHLW